MHSGDESFTKDFLDSGLSYMKRGGFTFCDFLGAVFRLETELSGSSV